MGMHVQASQPNVDAYACDHIYMGWHCRRPTGASDEACCRRLIPTLWHLRKLPPAKTLTKSVASIGVHNLTRCCIGIRILP